MIGCIIQARMGSARLPGKVMKKIDGEKPTISYLIEQLEFCKSFDDVVVATTNLKEDDVIEKHVRNMRIKVYRGDPLNVLDRYYNCAKINSYNTIVRITCDNPFVDPILVDKIVTTFSEGTFDYVSNTIDRTFPHGTEVEVFSYSALERAWKKAEKQHDKEHVTTFFHERNNSFSILNYSSSEDLSKYRWTLDTPNDLKLIKEIAKRIKKKPVHLNDILDIFQNEPDLIRINQS